MPNPATEAVKERPLNPIASAGAIDPTEEVNDTPVIPSTRADGSNDPTLEVMA